MVMQQVDCLRLGHAVRARAGQIVGRDDLERVLEVLEGTERLLARDPEASAAVANAEAIDEGCQVPDHVTILTEQAGASAFQSPAVRRALRGVV